MKCQSYRLRFVISGLNVGYYFQKSILTLKQESMHTVQILEFVLMDLVFYQRINILSGFY